jgi:hypothetical protein
VEYSNKVHTDKTQLLGKGSKETRKYSDKSIKVVRCMGEGRGSSSIEHRGVNLDISV